MKQSSVWVLRLSALWSIWVWAVLVRNMLKDHNHSLSFRSVHIVLAIISFGFALATLIIAQGLRSTLRASRERADPKSHESPAISETD